MLSLNPGGSSVSRKLTDSGRFPRVDRFPADPRWVMWRRSKRWQETSSSTASGLVSKSGRRAGGLEGARGCSTRCSLEAFLFLGNVRCLLLTRSCWFSSNPSHIQWLACLGIYQNPPPFFWTSCSGMDWNGLVRLKAAPKKKVPRDVCLENSVWQKAPSINQTSRRVPGNPFLVEKNICSSFRFR